jgi:hypothetical protein
MSYNVIFSSFADKDLQKFFKWYESQRYLLGWEFREDVNTCIDKIIDDRVEYQKFTEDIHKIRLSRSILYLLFKKRNG